MPCCGPKPRKRLHGRPFNVPSGWFVQLTPPSAWGTNICKEVTSMCIETRTKQNAGRAVGSDPSCWRFVIHKPHALFLRRGSSWAPHMRISLATLMASCPPVQTMQVALDARGRLAHSPGRPPAGRGCEGEKHHAHSPNTRPRRPVW